MKPEQRRPALLLLALGVAVGALGFVIGDERLQALCWLLAVPMLAGGAITIAWSNAAREIERLRGRD